MFQKLYNLEGEQKSSTQQHWRTDQRAELQGRWQKNEWLQVIIWPNPTYGHSLPFCSGVVVFNSVTEGVTRSLTFGILNAITPSSSPLCYTQSNLSCLTNLASSLSVNLISLLLSQGGQLCETGWNDLKAFLRFTRTGCRVHEYRWKTGKGGEVVLHSHNSHFLKAYWLTYLRCVPDRILLK